LLIGCPNNMVLGQIENKYRQKLEKLAKDLYGQTIELRFIVQVADKEEVSTPLFDELPQMEASREAVQSRDELAESSTSSHSHDQTFLNPNYTFDQFVVGPSNR